MYGFTIAYEPESTPSSSHNVRLKSHRPMFGALDACARWQVIQLTCDEAVGPVVLVVVFAGSSNGTNARYDVAALPPF